MKISGLINSVEQMALKKAAFDLENWNIDHIFHHSMYGAYTQRVKQDVKEACEHAYNNMLEQYE